MVYKTLLIGYKRTPYRGGLLQRNINITEKKDQYSMYPTTPTFLGLSNIKLEEQNVYIFSSNVSIFCRRLFVLNSTG